MSSTSRLIIIILVGLLLLSLPFAVRTAVLEWGSRRYQAPSTGTVDLAATREPTATAVPAPVAVAASETGTRAGPVVVDLAHYNRISPSQFQPLAARLAAYGVGMRFWMNPVPASVVDQTNLAGLSDQSAALATQLRDASAMVVVSPLFLWQPAEIEVLQQFVADGGRLLLISDPDVPEVPDYFVRDLNRLGEPFGVVFNDDYLYDLTRSDENYTHVYQGQFLDRAAALSGKVIVLYGVRSLSGPLVAQVRSSETSRSSLRTDLTAFTTVGLAGLASNHTAGRVLAMGDFDVLTDPYVSRHDNRYLLDFVAEFLVGAQRERQLADFPAYLGPRVALALGAGMPLDAPLLEHVSQLQSKLAATGRTMEMIGPSSYVLTGTLTFSRAAVLTDTAMLGASAADDPTDLIYAATFETADRETTLLGQAGIRLTAVAPTPQPTTAMPTPTATPVEDATPSAASGTPSPTVTPVPTRVLETGFSPQLLADASVILLRQRLSDGRQVTAVLGSDVAALEGGLIRLYTRTFTDCVSYPNLLVCPFESEATETEAPAIVAPLTTPTTDEAETPPDVIPEATETPLPTPAERSSGILLVDDNRTSAPEDGAGGSEATAYESALVAMGYAPELWQTASDGDPGADVLTNYRWVIWSRDAYPGEEARPATLRDLALFIEKGGRLTVSGRFPILGKSDRPATTVRDVELTDEVPELVVGLSGTPIQLAPDLPPAAPLENRWGPDSRVVLRRGPTSENAETPLMVALTGRDRTSGVTQRAIVLGMAVNWLPDADATQLVRNMAAWMMED